MSFMNIDSKFLNKIQANQIKQYIEKIIHYDQVWLPEGCNDFSISANNQFDVPH